MEIQDWFDVNNIEHLRAYQYLEQRGFWQYGFIPNYVTFPNGWHVLLIAKLADAWLHSKINLNGGEE